MGIFSRIRNSIRGRAEKVVEGLEQQNPEAVYSSAIEATKASVTDHRAHAAAMVQQRNKAAERIAQMERESEQVFMALKEAIDEGDDDSALVLQMRKSEIDEQLEIGRAELDELTERAEAARQAMIELKDGTKQLERERDRTLAQLAVAEARLSVQDANSNIADTPNARALGTVRESIERLESQAGLDEGSGARAKALGKASDLSAQKQLEELKKKLGKS